jgi:hypothetical protein
MTGGLYGERMRAGLRRLGAYFERAMPSSGRYVPYPAVTDEHGLVHVPPRVPMTPMARALIGAGVVVIGAAALAVSRRARE